MTDGALRMRVFAFIALVLFGGLVARLWYLQGLEAQREEFQQRAQTNVLEEVYEEAPRGRILDRNGRVIVDNKVVEVVTIDRGIVDDLDPVERDAMLPPAAQPGQPPSRSSLLQAKITRLWTYSDAPMSSI